MKEALSSAREYRALIDSFGDSPAMEQKQQLADAHIRIYRPYVGIWIMFLSACFSRSIVPMALIFIRIMLGMFLNIPERLRISSQIWDWLPINYLFASNIYDTRLFPFFGHYLTSWQILPVLYAVLGILIAVAGRSVYKRGRR